MALHRARNSVCKGTSALLLVRNRSLRESLPYQSGNLSTLAVMVGDRSGGAALFVAFFVLLIWAVKSEPTSAFPGVRRPSRVSGNRDRAEASVMMASTRLPMVTVKGSYHEVGLAVVSIHCRGGFSLTPNCALASEPRSRSVLLVLAARRLQCPSSDGAVRRKLTRLKQLRAFESRGRVSV